MHNFSITQTLPRKDEITYFLCWKFEIET